MVRLHLVGFTTDLKNLIFAEERGSTAGGFVVSLDDRLRHTLDEVARLDEDFEGYEPGEAEESGAPQEPPAPRIVSKLTPKEIQSLLRKGKTEEQVARLAGTDVEWIRRFSFAILAERRDVIDAVTSATLSKPRLGKSSMPIGEAVEASLAAKRVRMNPEAIEAAWKAMRKKDRWQVSFEYESRGQKRLARYSFDPNARLVEPLNDIALELGWRSEARDRAAGPRSAVGAAKPASGVRPSAGRSGPKPASAGRSAGSSRSAAGRADQERAASAGGRAAKPAQSTSRRSMAARAKAEEGSRSGERSVPRRRLIQPPEEPSSSQRPVPTSEEDPDATSDEFIIQRPRKPERPKLEGAPYSTLPEVWRPNRRG